MKATIESKHLDHVMWIAKMKHYKNELVTLENRLEGLAGNSKKTEYLARLEHFQNQFIVQKSNVNEIIHALKMDEKNVRYNRIVNPDITERAGSGLNERDRAETFEKNMKELKSDFERFATKGR
jgi:hypothetical protein